MVFLVSNLLTSNECRNHKRSRVVVRDTQPKVMIPQVRLPKELAVSLVRVNPGADPASSWVVEVTAADIAPGVHRKTQVVAHSKMMMMIFQESLDPRGRPVEAAEGGNRGLDFDP